MSGEWKMVPVEPTTTQLAAGRDAWCKDPTRRSSTLYSAMVAAAPAPSDDGAEKILQARIAEVIREEGLDGAACGWRPCTGCHETEDGYSVGHYQHSKVFGCEVGSGCRECGGLGVAWERYPASALASMARDIDADLCPICAQPLKPDDICATDITEGICHAACLEGAPVVDLETGEETGGKADTYRYGDDVTAESGG